MKQYPLDKSNKLCSLIAIEALFSKQSEADAALAFPLRVVWRINKSRKADIETPKFFISVPKKKIRHAVNRVTMRRRIREAYRLNRLQYLGEIRQPVDMAIIYVADKPMPYASVQRSLCKLLSKIALKCSSDSSEKS